MAAQAKLLTFAKSGATGTQTLTGVGFPGTAVVFWTPRLAAPGLADGHELMDGFATAIAQVMRSGRLEDNASSPKSHQVERTDRCVAFHTATTGATPVEEAGASFTGFTADGFTLNWITNNGGTELVHAMVIQCDAAELLIFNTAGASQSIAASFQPDALIWLGGSAQYVDYKLGAHFGGLHGLGFVDPLALTNVCTQILAEGSARFARRTQRPDACFSIPLVTGALKGQEVSVGAVTGVSPTAVTIGRAPSGTNTRQYALCLKGVSVAVGTFTTPVSTGNALLALPFPPSAVLLQSAGLLPTAVGPQAGASLAIGAWGSDAVQGHAWSGSADGGSVSVTAKTIATDAILGVYTPSATGSASAVVAHGVAGAASGAGLTIAWDVVPVAPINIQYFAIAGVAPTVTACDGGTVPISIVPPAGDDFSALRQQTDAWLELDLDEGTEGHGPIEGPLNDPPTYHAGKKTARVTSFGEITQKLCDPVSGYQSSGCTVSLAEQDRHFLTKDPTEAYFTREGRICVALRSTRKAQGAPHVALRGALTGYNPKAGLSRDLEFLDVLAKDFREFGKETPLGQTFKQWLGGDAPVAIQDQTVPVYFGRYSNGSSEGGPPIPDGDTDRGADFFSSGSRKWGYGNLPGPTAPASISVAEEAGGSIATGTTPYNQLAFCAWGVDVSGVEGDPCPFHGAVTANITGTGKQYRVTITPPAGPLPNKWRIAMGTVYFGPRWNQILEIDGTATEAVFTANPTWDIPPFTATSPITPGATLPTFYAFYNYAGAFRYADGTTVLSPTGEFLATLYRRPARISFRIPDGAGTPIELIVVRKTITGDWSLKFVGPATTVDEAGRVYLEDDFRGTGAEKLPNGWPKPHGKLPIIDCNLPEESIPGYGSGWLPMFLNGAPSQTVLDVYSGSRKIDGEFGVTVLAVGKVWPFTEKYRIFNDLDVFPIYVRGPLVASHRDGTAPLTADICGPDENGDGSGRTVRTLARQAWLALNNYVFNRTKPIGAWNPPATFTDGVAKLANFVEAAEAIETSRIGEPYEGNLYIGDGMTPRGLINLIMLNGDYLSGPEGGGQFQLAHINENPDLTAAPVYEHVASVMGNIAQDTQATSGLLNLQHYSAQYDFVDKVFLIVSAKVDNQESIDREGVTAEGQAREYKFIQNAIVADDVTRRAVLRGRYPPRYVGWWTYLRGLNADSDTAKVVLLTDIEGAGASGFVRQPIAILLRKKNLSAGRVYLWGLDLGRIVASRGVLGPDGLPTFTAATAAQQAKYIYASDADGLMSNGTRALRTS